jgi:uncharacterized SAM-binding protein YcdF (DUF218 family)
MRFLLLFALVALVAASVALFVLREDDPVTHADAVVVLFGGRARLPVGIRLVERGVAPLLVVSEGADRRWRMPGLCARRDIVVLCPVPAAESTRGEARMIARLARERGWDSLVVVTSRFHLFRAGLLIRRCFGGRLAMVGAPSSRWRLPVQVALEWAKLARAEILRGC